MGCVVEHHAEITTSLRVDLMEEIKELFRLATKSFLVGLSQRNWGLPLLSHMSYPWSRSTSMFKEFLLAGLIIFAFTWAAWLVEPYTGYQTVALLYLLLVVVVGLKLRRGPTLIVAVTSAALWNYLFVPPYFTIRIQEFHDGIMFLVFIAVALAIGHLTSRLRRSEIIERQRERRTAALYELAHQAAFAMDLDTGLQAVVNLIESTFGGKTALLIRQKDHSLSNVPHPASSFSLSDKDKAVAEWAFNHRTPAGRFTETLPDSEAVHIP